MSSCYILDWNILWNCVKIWWYSHMSLTEIAFRIVCASSHNRNNLCVFSHNVTKYKWLLEVCVYIYGHIVLYLWLLWLFKRFVHTYCHIVLCPYRNWNCGCACSTNRLYKLRVHHRLKLCVLCVYSVASNYMFDWNYFQIAYMYIYVCIIYMYI